MAATLSQSIERAMRQYADANGMTVVQFLSDSDLITATAKWAAVLSNNTVIRIAVDVTESAHHG